MGQTVRQNAGRWLLLGCVLALAGCGGGGTFPALAPPVASKPDDNGIVTLIRPQVARVGDDPIQVVLHWEDREGPIGRQTGLHVDWFDVCNALTFHVTTPDGKKLTLKPSPQKNVRQTSAEMYYSPTLFVKLTQKGVEVTPFAYAADWEGGAVAALGGAGKFEISVSGELMPGKDEKRKNAGPTPFASGPVTVERGVEGYLPLDEIAAAARKKLGSKLKAGHATEEKVYDDADGDRLVHLTGPSSELWHFKIHTVHVSPEGKILNVFSKDVSNCLAEGTRLDGESGSVAIERVRAGDRVWGYDLGRGERVLTTVREVRRAEVEQTLRLGCGLRLTGDHPVYASGRWLSAQELSQGDELLRADGTRVAVGKVERVSGAVAVYDVTVDEPHNFFAAGVLVHNKTRAHWPQLDDLWYRLWSPDGVGK
jgi:hypothetical protein